MELVAFILFAALVLAWLVSPGEAKATVTTNAPLLKPSESPAD